MRLKKHAPLIESTLKRVAARPAAFLPSNCCRRAASSQAYPEKVAVLGGGISGLASAYFVAKEFPQSRITVHEANRDSGGWIQSRKVQVPGGHVLFEYGPRTLRPGSNALVTAQLIQDLDLTDNVVFTKKDAPGASNRYIYYPDRLQQLPSAGSLPPFWHLAQLWQSGLLDGAFSALLEPIRPARSDTLEDESIGSFVARRLDKRLANNLVSAVMHGIYAGDVWQLSARTLLAQAWMLEQSAGSIYRGLLKIQGDSQVPGRALLYHPYDLELFKAMRVESHLDRPLRARLDDCAMFTFKGGMSELTQALQSSLQENKQVDFRFDSRVHGYKMSQDTAEQVEVTTKSQGSPTTEKYNLVISSLRSPELTPFVTVMTVNLYFPNPRLLSQKGFGYLIPQTVAFEKNPERALGVIFDSDAITGQDTAEGTKLTVMLGGHYWDGWTHFPSESEAYDLAMSLLRRQLHITEEPTHYQANLSKDCIPQYTVGYEERLKMHAYQIRDRFKGKVRIVGNQVHGVGVNDCIRGAWAVARGLRGMGWKGNGTGLERALTDGAWSSASANQMPPLPKE